MMQEGQAINQKVVNIYTDGACSQNPGKGGYAAIIEYNGVEKLISGGYKMTTNNRMEIMAVIRGLGALRKPCNVRIYSDSKYVVDAMRLGWVKKWRANGWIRRRGEYALNPDLWEEVLTLCDIHNIEWIWVRGHNGHPQNERCDKIAVAAINGADLEDDIGYSRTSSNNV